MSSLSWEMDQRNYIIHPHKFALWLFILTVIMIFGGLTSAYIVQRGFLKPEQQIIFDLPPILWTNLAVILGSSVTMQFAVWAARRNDSQKAIAGLILTFVLGLVFLYGQFNGWNQMVASGLPMVDRRRLDNAVSFFYIFTGLHGLHIVAALIVLLTAMANTAMNRFRPGRKQLTYELTAIFWHFLGLLWIYLFIFLKFTQR
ncbi:MAG: heme-copper oxidase subunit III [Bacteroidetes bacterium]|nr:MAG: heme-copper oxidase subunit III [Bacteroidota bacterium]